MDGKQLEAIRGLHRKAQQAAWAADLAYDSGGAFELLDYIGELEHALKGAGDSYEDQSAHWKQAYDVKHDELTVARGRIQALEDQVNELHEIRADLETQVQVLTPLDDIGMSD